VPPILGNKNAEALLHLAVWRSTFGRPITLRPHLTVGLPVRKYHYIHNPSRAYLKNLCVFDMSDK
jgi:hypothetical protein